MPRRGLALCVLIGVVGCGDDENVGRDGGDEDAADAPGRDITGEFDSPSDFERLGCEPGSLAGFDPTGIWHVDVAIPGFGNGPSVLRFDPDDGGGFRARVQGYDAITVELTDDDLLVRVLRTSGDGLKRLRVYDACRLGRTDGQLYGHFAGCNAEDEECYTGTFEGPRVVRIAGEAEAQGLSLVSEWAGDPAAPWGDGLTVNVRVKDGLAYLARYWDGLRIVDVSDPANPSDVGWSPPMLPDAGELYNDVKIVDGPAGTRYALMASSDRGVVSVDVTDPSQPHEAAIFPPIPQGEDHVNVHTLFTEAAGATMRAYIANTTTIALEVWDVTDPAQPSFLGMYRDPGVETDFGAYLHDLYVEDQIAYLNYWSLGLVVVDTSDPSAIAPLGSFRDYERRTSHSNWVTTTSGGRRIAVHGDEDFGAHVRTIDVDPASPTYLQRLGEFSLRPEVSVHNIMAFGDTAYIAYYQDGVRLLDVSDPTAPSLRAYFNTWNGQKGDSFYEGAIGLDLDLPAGLLYVADDPRGLIVLRLPP